MNRVVCRQRNEQSAGRFYCKLYLVSRRYDATHKAIMTTPTHFKNAATAQYFHSFTHWELSLNFRCLSIARHADQHGFPMHVSTDPEFINNVFRCLVSSRTRHTAQQPDHTNGPSIAMSTASTVFSSCHVGSCRCRSSWNVLRAASCFLVACCSSVAALWRSVTWYRRRIYSYTELSL